MASNDIEDGAYRPATPQTIVPSSERHAYYYLDNIWVIELPDAGEDKNTQCQTPVQIGSGLDCYLPRLAGTTYNWTYGDDSYIPDQVILSGRNSPIAEVMVDHETIFRLTVTLPGQAPYTDDVVVSVEDGNYTARVIPTCGSSTSIVLNIGQPGDGYNYDLYRLNYASPTSTPLAGPIHLHGDPSISTATITDEGLYKLEKTLTSGHGCAVTSYFHILGTTKKEQDLHSLYTYDGTKADVVVLGNVELGDAVTFTGDVQVWVDGTADAAHDWSTCSISQEVTGYWIKLLTTDDPFTYPNVLTLEGSHFRGICRMWKGIILEENADLYVKSKEPVIIEDAEIGISTLEYHEDAVELKNVEFKNCLNGIKVYTEDYAWLQDCNFHSEKDALRYPYNIGRFSDFTYPNSGPCLVSEWRRFQSEIGIQVLPKPGAGNINLTLENVDHFGYMIGIYSPSNKLGISWDGGSLNSLLYGVLATSNTFSFTNLQGKLNKKAWIALAKGQHSIQNCTVQVDPITEVLGANEAALQSLVADYETNTSGNGFDDLMGAHAAAVKATGKLTFSDNVFTSALGGWGVMTLAGGTPRTQSFTGNTFTNLKQAIQIGGGQTVAPEVTDNTFTIPADGIGIRLKADFYRPTTSNGYTDAEFHLRCNQFITDEQDNSTRYGMIIDYGAQLGRIGTCQDKAGNGWPYYGQSIGSNLSTTLRQSPSGWISIQNNTGSYLEYHRFKNEFVQALNAGAMSLIRECNDPNYGEKEWNNPDVSGLNGCATLESFYSPTSRLTMNKAEMNNSGVVLYPNPTTGIMHIKKGVEIFDVLIIDAYGRIIQQEKLDSRSEHTLSIGHSKGIYRIIFKSDQEVRYSANVIIE